MEFNRTQISITAIIILFAVYYFTIGGGWASPVGKELANIEAGTTISANQLASLGDEEQICVLHPYAVRSGDIQKSSIQEIFGDINYSDWESNIVQRHEVGYNWTIYSVRSGSVSDAYPIRFPRGAVFDSSKDLSAGCYKASDVCFVKMPKNQHGELPIKIYNCKGEI